MRDGSEPLHGGDAVAVGSVTHRFFGTDSALFVGPLAAPSVHSHHALQGCVALDGWLGVGIGNQEPVPVPGALIAPDAPDAVSASGPVAHFYVLPESPAGARLVEALAGRRVKTLEEGSLGDVRGLLQASLADEGLFPDCLMAMLELMLQGAPPESRRDPRVAAVLESLRHRSVDTPLAVLAEEAGLSPDRLRHLIRQVLGIPLRRYRRWARLLVAIDALRAARSVSVVAHTAGFADSAHLCRVFRDAFTVPPSVFPRDSRFVQSRGDGDT